MSASDSDGAPWVCGVGGREGNGGRAAGLLSLAASPACAFMALLTGLSGGSAMAMCPMADASPLGWMPGGGMVLMYLLMSLFHAAPWVRLMARRRGVN
ncbi:MAG TPA: hypothetical protein VLC74_01510 [Rhizomicrobium sp.]|nr:hypothetical protein [Rhizomicrobium sp.]